MKLCSIGFAACLLLSQCHLYFCEEPSQCIKDLSHSQAEALQHFNGIFGSFKATSKLNDAVIDGPIIASNISSSGYGFNTILQKSNCDAANHILRYGLLTKEGSVQGDIFGEIWTRNSTVDTRNTKSASCSAVMSREEETEKDLLDSIWSFIPEVVTGTSHKLASFQPDAIISPERRLVFTETSSTVLGYSFLKLPACSDTKCSPIEKHETDPRILKGDKKEKVIDQEKIHLNTTLVFNVPVYVGATFTISTLDVNKNIPSCQTIFNFYPIDQAGKLVTDANAYFTLVRSPDVVIAGTILAPQARIVDSKTGYFGGQLISLQSYTGTGASIRGFDEKCSFHPQCWPSIPYEPANLTNSIATPARSKTESTEQKPESTHSISNTSVTKTVKLEANTNPSSFHPMNLLDVNDALADVVNEFSTQTFTTTKYTNTVDEFNILVVTETIVSTDTETEYEQDLSTTTIDQTMMDFGYATSYSARIVTSFLPTSYSTLSGISTVPISPIHASTASSSDDWWESKHHHKHKHHHHKYKDEDEDEDEDEDDEDDDTEEDEECDEDE